MKNYEAAVQALKINNKEIEEKENKIIELDYKAEIRTAIQSNNMEEYKKLQAKADTNKDTVKELSDALYLLKLESRILKENIKAALFIDAYPIIVDICAKYQGKPYGEATRKKLDEEGKKNGFYFSFSGGYSGKKRDKLSIISAYAYYSDRIEVYASYSKDGKQEPFITDENKINVANASAKPYEKFVEDPKARAKELAKAIREYQELLKTVDKARHELESILPYEGIRHPEYIRDYYTGI